jgi:N-acetylmuramoyl-L-alanine amidase
LQANGVYGKKESFLFSRITLYMTKRFLTITISAAIVILSCSRNPYRATNKTYKKQVKEYARSIRGMPPANSINNAGYWVGTTNFNLRKPNFVIIHHTAQNSCEQTLKTFTLPRTSVSAHYVICKDGTIYHMLNDYLRAWHAGVGKWGNMTDINSTSIGIELDNNGFDPFDGRQISSLMILLDTLKARHNIPAANFIGHSDIAPTRKVDPNIYFPWKQLSEKGFGLWYDDTTGVEIPEYFDHLQGLRLIGYDVRDTTAAIRAFKRHFVQDSIPVLNGADKKVIYQLSKKF